MFKAPVGCSIHNLMFFNISGSSSKKNFGEISIDYQSVGAFAADCRLTCENCKKYHGSKTEGAVFVEQAERLL